MILTGRQIRSGVFKQLVNNLALRHPDLGSSQLPSVLKCAVICFWNTACITVLICQERGHVGCQISRTEGTCMQRNEAFVKPACKLYQKEVGISGSELTE
jgi:hypothetical protein